MRYVDLIKSQVIDLLAALDAKGISTVPVQTLIRELNARGNDFDESSIVDILDDLAIVKNVEDNIVYFNSDPHNSDYEPDQAEKQDKKIDSLARKKVGKELKR